MSYPTRAEGSGKYNKGTGGLGNKKTRGDHPNDSIIKIGQNTKKSPGDLRLLSVTQTPTKARVKNSQKSKKNNN